MSGPFLSLGPKPLIPRNEGTTSPAATLSFAERFKGAVPRAGAYARKQPAQPVLGADREPDAKYVLDTGVGLAFAHVNRLDLLSDHYGEQLVYVEDVELEWRRQATRTFPPLPNGHTAEEKAERAMRLQVKAAAARLLDEMPTMFGQAHRWDLNSGDIHEVDDLIRELSALEKPKVPDLVGDRGECASVLLGKRHLANGVKVVVLCCNEHRGRVLAGNHGLGHRDMATVLREMVRDDQLTAEEAFALYEEMAKVTELPLGKRPAAAAEFS